MCAKNRLLIFSSFLDIWENVEWPRFFGPPGTLTGAYGILENVQLSEWYKISL